MQSSKKYTWNCKRSTFLQIEIEEKHPILLNITIHSKNPKNLNKMQKDFQEHRTYSMH